MLLGLALATPASITLAEPLAVRALRLDGSALVGSWSGCSEEGVVTLEAKDGAISVPLDDLAAVIFRDDSMDASAGADPAPNPVQPRDDRVESPVVEGTSVQVHLADGGSFEARLPKKPFATDGVRVRPVWSDEFVVPFDRLAGIRFVRKRPSAQAESVFHRTLANRLPGKDILVSGSDDDVKTPRGRLTALGGASGTFVFGDRPRVFQTSKMCGIVFAAGAPGASDVQYPVRVTLVDGSVFTSRLSSAGAETMTLETSFGQRVVLPLERLARLDVTSERVVYLDSVSPTRQHVEGLLHRSWPIRINRSVAGGALAVAGRTFTRGIGVHSRTEMTFVLDEPFERFAATVGINDAVRPRGSVVLKILGDDRVLFESDPITGTDDPLDVSARIENVKSLTLIVDYADELDLADHLDLGNARLIRAAGGGFKDTR